MEGREKSPLRIGWESAKANAVPMVVLWTVAACLIVGLVSLRAQAATYEFVDPDGTVRIEIAKVY